MSVIKFPTKLRVISKKRIYHVKPHNINKTKHIARVEEGALKSPLDTLKEQLDKLKELNLKTKYYMDEILFHNPTLEKE